MWASDSALQELLCRPSEDGHLLLLPSPSRGAVAQGSAPGQWQRQHPVTHWTAVAPCINFWAGNETNVTVVFVQVTSLTGNQSIHFCVCPQNTTLPEARLLCYHCIRNYLFEMFPFLFAISHLSLFPGCFWFPGGSLPPPCCCPTLGVCSLELWNIAWLPLSVQTWCYITGSILWGVTKDSGFV